MGSGQASHLLCAREAQLAFALQKPCDCHLCEPTRGELARTNSRGKFGSGHLEEWVAWPLHKQLRFPSGPTRGKDQLKDDNRQDERPEEAEQDGRWR